MPAHTVLRANASSVAILVVPAAHTVHSHPRTHRPATRCQDGPQHALHRVAPPTPERTNARSGRAVADVAGDASAARRAARADRLGVARSRARCGSPGRSHGGGRQVRTRRARLRWRAAVPRTLAADADRSDEPGDAGAVGGGGPAGGGGVGVDRARGARRGRGCADRRRVRPKAASCFSWPAPMHRTRKHEVGGASRASVVVNGRMHDVAAEALLA